MGHRTIKRVPRDFGHPLNQVWPGYLNEHYPAECSACDGGGYNPATKQIDDDFYALDDRSRRWCDAILQDEVQALVDANRLMDFTHEWSQEGGWQRRADNYVPDASEVNRWSRGPRLGHDGINRWVLIETRAKRLGVYGHCDVCDGEGCIFRDEAHRAAYDAWEPTEPPQGDGFQLWETTSEGSPVSPVFDSAESLASWCENNATVFGREKTSKAKWLQMFGEDGGVDSGSLGIGMSGRFGAAINMPV